MSLEQIELRSFRTHKKLTIKFDPGVTTIVGESFDGKSNIVRGIRWAALNKPSGDKMINWDSDKAAARLSIDGEKVTRKKGKGVNIYKLTGVKKPYEAFGLGVPDKIVKLLNISELNFLNQFKPPFWFCESAPEVSRQLNSIVDLEIIDSTLSNISKEVNKTKSSIKVIAKRVETARGKKKELSYIPRMNKDFKAIESQREHLDKKQAQSAQLGVLIQKVSKYQKIQKRCRALEQLGILAVNAGGIYRKTRSERLKLSDALKGIEFHTQKIKRQPASIKPLETLVKQYEKIKNKRLQLASILLTIEYEEGIKCDQLQKRKELEAQIKKLTKGKCPVCQKPMKA